MRVGTDSTGAGRIRDQSVARIRTACWARFVRPSGRIRSAPMRLHGLARIVKPVVTNAPVPIQTDASGPACVVGYGSLECVYKGPVRFVKPVVAMRQFQCRLTPVDWPAWSDTVWLGSNASTRSTRFVKPVVTHVPVQCRLTPVAPSGRMQFARMRLQGGAIRQASSSPMRQFQCGPMPVDRPRGECVCTSGRIRLARMRLKRRGFVWPVVTNARDFFAGAFVRPGPRIDTI